MGLFQRRPQVSDPIQMYFTASMQKTVLLVGLGNPGKEYVGTRHNVGFECLDAFVAKADGMGEWTDKKSLKCQLVSGQVNQTKIYAIKPDTFMNNSGEAVRAVADYYKIPYDKIVIIHDELDIKFGSIRTRMGGSAAGHNGIKSVTQHVGEDTGRIRIGVGPKKPAQMDSSDFVLAKFTAKEQEQLGNMKREVTAILSEYFFSAKLPAETRDFIV
ncbi:MAG TPA: aminoacyl-tRNA hydrolase [Candidatus Microsaccharimonas sp.]|nr:aminoacyl-tRNA hydrolase [Candidatus Microsaccharimonas sp.]